MARTRRLAERALELDPELAEAHASLAGVQSSYDWDWPGMERSLQRSLELNPNYVFAHQIYAGRLAFLGRLDEALAHAVRAKRLDPLGVNPARESTLGLIHWIRGDLERAVAAWESDLELEPADPISWEQLGVAYCEAGQFEAGIGALERATELSPGDALITGDLAYCYARAGRSEEARAMAADLERRAELTYVSPMSIAIIYLGLGDDDLAFAWLERAYELRALALPFLVTDARWYALADDPRYADLVERIRLPVPEDRIAQRRG
jgi:tetratricopeptide (TPR) repeat protein